MNIGNNIKLFSDKDKRKQIYVNIIYFSITSIGYFFTNGIENSVFVDGYNVCKSLGNIIFDGIVITYILVCLNLYDKKIKLKKTKLFLGLIVASILGIITNHKLFAGIKIQFNYLIYILSLCLLLVVNLILLGVNKEK